jgi:transposase
LLDGHEALLRPLTAEKPGITLAELQAALAERCIVVGSLTTIWTTLRRLGLSHKKDAQGQRARPVGRHRLTQALADLAAAPALGGLLPR